MEHLDLLFAQVGNLSTNQQQMAAQFETSTKIVEQLLLDQRTLSQQIEVTGQAVANLTLHPPRPSSPVSEPPSPPHRRFAVGTSRFPGRPPPNGASRHSSDGDSQIRAVLPKLSFPRFDGSDPTIWKDKCVDYFTLCNIPEPFWTTTAALHMDDRAAKWVQVYKLEHCLDSWSDFIEAVEQKFGATDYREALSGFFDLHQTTTVDDYITAFEGFQYQLTMHNRHLGEMFFVTQFIKGLLPEISVDVLSQVSDTMQRAIMLA